MRWDQHVSRAIALRTDVNPKPIRATNGRHDRCIASSQQNGLGIGDIGDLSLGALIPCVGRLTQMCVGERQIGSVMKAI